VASVLNRRRTVAGRSPPGDDGSRQAVVGLQDRPPGWHAEHQQWLRHTNEGMAMELAYRRYCKAAAVAFVLAVLVAVPIKLLQGRLGHDWAHSALHLGSAVLAAYAGWFARSAAPARLYLGGRCRLLRAWGLRLVHAGAAARHAVRDSARRCRQPLPPAVERPGAGGRAAGPALGALAGSRTRLGRGRDRLRPRVGSRHSWSDSCVASPGSKTQRRPAGFDAALQGAKAGHQQSCRMP
jgi:hypothetical protein